MHSQLVAYIDASTGSYLLTALAGGLATIWFFVRTKVGSLFKRDSKPSDNAAAQGQHETVTDTEPDMPTLKQE